jgi:ABC-type transport system involved in multi-copper enzyme maturation permease subunit
MRAVYWRELSELLRSLRFPFVLLLFLTGMALNGFVMGGFYQDLQRMHGHLQTQNEERLHEAAAHVEQLAMQFAEGFGEGRALAFSAPPPKLLHVLGSSQLSGPKVFNWSFPNLLEPAPGRSWNDELPVRPALDWEFLVRILLSFIAVILVYDIITGERERGTLLFTLSYPVTRGRLLWGKFLAVMTIIIWLLLAGCIISTLIYLARSGVRLDMQDYARLALFLCGSLLYVAIFVAVGLLISSRVKSSVSSLVLLLIFWLTVTIVIPQGGTIAVQGLVRPVTDVQVEGKLRPEVEKQIGDMLGDMDAFVRKDIEAARKDDYAAERKFARRVNQLMSVMQSYVDRQQESYRRQENILRNVLRLTPAGFYQLGSENLLGTGAARQQRLQQSVSKWGEQFVQFVQQQDQLDSTSPHIYYVAKYMSQRAVDPRSIPRWSMSEPTLSESLKSGAMDWLWLALELCVALCLAFASFTRAPISEVN